MKANKYARNLIHTYYIKYIYRRSSNHRRDILTIAKFLLKNDLIGIGHYNMVKDDIELINKHGINLMKVNPKDKLWRGYYITLTGYKFRISTALVDELKEEAEQDGPLGNGE